jgi:methylated-DNA-[protein]-cysteine S-methyltransferase
MPSSSPAYVIFSTSAGFCGLAWSTQGILRFTLPVRDSAAADRLLLRKRPDAQPAEPPPQIAAVIAAVQRYFAGEPEDFSALALDLDDQDAFFSAVYAALRRVGWGHTTTYGDLAKAIGSGPEAARDVGQAMAKNPIPLLIPCHRVLAAGNRIGGFSAPGGSTTKLRMLELEGVQPAAAPAPAQASFGF